MNQLFTKNQYLKIGGKILTLENENKMNKTIEKLLKKLNNITKEVEI